MLSQVAMVTEEHSGSVALIHLSQTRTTQTLFHLELNPNALKRHLVNILAKNVRFRGEFGFYTWFSFIVNGQIVPETSTKNSIFVIRKIRMVIVSSLSGIRETINVEKH